MDDGNGHRGLGFWAALRGLWNGGYGLPLDARVRDDAGLPPLAGPPGPRPSSPFVGAWLR